MVEEVRKQVDPGECETKTVATTKNMLKYQKIRLAKVREGQCNKETIQAFSDATCVGKACYFWTR